MIEQILSFVTVVDAGGFSEAGRRLSLPKSTISHRVQQLEERLGVRLLHRTPRVVRVTEEGAVYYQRCVRILAELEDAETEVRQEPKEPTGTLRLSGPIEFGMQILSGVLAEFLKAHPHVRLKLELTSRNVDLVEEGYDAALRIGTLEDSALVSRRILSIPRGLYASPDYLAAHGRPERPEDLDRHACLRFETAFYHGAWVFTGPGGKVSFQPAGTVEANNLTVLRDAAIAGLGVALLPCYQCREAERDGRLERVMVDWTPESADVYVLYPSKRHLASRVRAFLTYLDRNMERLTRDIRDGAGNSVQ
ncbi:LysR family transcriptional regulator [Aliidongia dinghuensis]|uniref:LysR family transcriptional regulator n=1 Tax=Aliidongia dinghuensis TaxID=1867774 RepID=A0A8J2YPS4_9PROT|nr:LysR family transcriptional regulator [Aliidongia dinghuensis]GGF04349.1 LysR family transcriptional regulator [Aliidongia dinghuensis]